MNIRSLNKMQSSFVLLLSFLMIFAFVAFFIYLQKNSFGQVKKYTPVIRRELEKYHLEKYTPVLVALMQQESHGKGNDPMQASESVGLPPNSIKDPEESIKIGVNHFRNVLLYGEEKHVDFATILQSYNMGISYIDFVSRHGGKNSEELAKEYSLLQVQKKPKIYTCKKVGFDVRYPYCYGDFAYSSKVEKKIKSLTGNDNDLSK